MKLCVRLCSCLEVSIFFCIRFDSINVFQSIFWGFVCVGCLLMTSYCSNLGKVSLPILHSICWLFCGSLFHQLFIRKSYSHLPRGGICNCALARLTCVPRIAFIICVIQARIISANKHALRIRTHKTAADQRRNKGRWHYAYAAWARKSRNKTQINCVRAI